jgi:hypothetical protein
MTNPSLEHVVGRQADRILDALLLQPLVDLRLGEGCIGAEVEIDATLAIAGNHRLQDEAPIRGAVDGARPEERPLEIAELVEHEQRAVAVTAEVSVPRRALLSSVGWVLGIINVENNVVGRFAGVDLVDPSAGESREGREVDVARQPLGLEAPHLGGCGLPQAQWPGRVVSGMVLSNPVDR